MNPALNILAAIVLIAGMYACCRVILRMMEIHETIKGFDAEIMRDELKVAEAELRAEQLRRIRENERQAQRKAR